MGFIDTVKKFNPIAKVTSMFGMTQTMHDLKKKIGILSRAQRPMNDNFYGSKGYKGSSYNRYPFALYTIYDVAKNSDVITGMHVSLRMETFRNGLEVLPASEVLDDMDFDEEEVKPDNDERFFIIKNLEKINFNNQSMVEVMEELEDDYNILDLAVMYLRYAYEINDKEEIVKKEFREAIRQDPLYIELVQNNRSEFGRDDDGNKLMCTVNDRTNLVTIRPGQDEVNNKGHKLYPAWYRQQEAGSGGGGVYYYFEWELVHDSRYRPGKGTGYSPIITAWQKIRTIQQQDNYMLELYEGKRPPKGLLVFGTANEETLQEAWEGMIQRAREDKHLPGIMGVPPAASSSGNGGKFVEFIDFMKSPVELDFAVQRTQFENTLGALYGVSPILRSDTSAGGGLNNEGMQFTVTNRRVESNQGRYNRIFLQAITDAFGVEGWAIRLKPSEEQDEMAKLQRQEQSLINGEAAARLGLEVEFNSKTGEVVIKDGVIVPPSQSFDLFDDTTDFGPSPSSTEPIPSDVPEEPNVEVSKDVKKLDGIRGFSSLKIAINREIKKFLRTYKRMPTEGELDDRITKIKGRLTRELKKTVAEHYLTQYKESMKSVENQFNQNIKFEKTDQEALKVLANQDVLQKAFKNLSTDMSKGVRDVIRKAFDTDKGLSLQQLQKQIREITKVAESRAETIARTETGKVNAAARRNSYKKVSGADELVYKHIGPNDSRTTNTSKRIKRKTAKGVPWPDYVSIVKQESKKDFPTWKVNSQSPVSHFNSRHTFTASRG